MPSMHNDLLGAAPDDHRTSKVNEQIGGSARVLPNRARHSESQDRSALPQSNLRSDADWTGLPEAHGSPVEDLVKAASAATWA